MMAEKERRQYPRTELLKPVRCEVNSPIRGVQAVDAQMVDISKGGACISAEVPQEEGRVVRLWVSVHSTDVEIPSLAEVMWEKEDEDGYRTGLQFLT